MNFEKLTAYLDSLEETLGVPGLDCMVMQDHRVIYRHQAGHRDGEKQQKVEGNELYDVYSATKVITMTAVMQLVEKGVLDLTDPVSKYIPAFADARVVEDFEYVPFPPKMPEPDAPTRPAENPILLWHLMSMTAGLTYNLGHPAIQALKEQGADTVAMMDGIARMPLIFEPGTRYAYSLGHDVMAAVVEIASGERFADYLQRHIFGPLGIKDMYMHLTDKEKARLTFQWSQDFETGEIKPANFGNGYRLTDRYDSGGAGLSCSVESYCAVMDALACGGVGSNGARILKPETIRILAQPRLNEQQLRDFGRGHMGYNYGLGVRTLVHRQVAKSPIGEFGWDGAAGAFSLVDMENRLSIFYAQEVLGMIKIYFEAHPAIRDLVYEGLETE